jgi:hypothetical protein
VLAGRLDRLPAGVDPLAKISEGQFERLAEIGQLIQRCFDTTGIELARDEPVAFAGGGVSR